MMNNRILYIFISAILLAACTMQSHHADERPVLQVRVETIAGSVSVSRHTYVGEIDVLNSVELSPLAAGQVTAVYVKTADKVVKGQVLLTIDSTQAVNALQSAEAILLQAEDGYARAMQLYQDGGLTEQKRVEIESQLSRARSMRQAALRTVQDCALRAPMDGVIAECSARVGQSISPVIPVVRLMDMQGYTVEFSVPETEVAAIHIGDEARMHIPALDTNDIRLIINEKSLIPNRIAHTYKVKALVCDEVQLMPGMMAKVQLTMDHVVGVILPPACIQILPDGARVWVVEDSVAHRRMITVDRYVNEGVLITDGLHTGDQVVTVGYQKLYQGAPVQIIE